MPKLTTETTNRKGLIIKRATAIDALKALFFFLQLIQKVENMVP